MKLTQIKLAKLAIISQPYVSQICSGERAPSWKTAKKLTAATGLEEKAWMENDQVRIAEVVQMNPPKETEA